MSARPDGSRLRLPDSLSLAILTSVVSLAERLGAYAAHRMEGARDIRVAELDRIYGGASRETWRFRLDWREEDAPHSRRLILRRDPPGSLIDTERAIEFAAYRAFHGTAVPVPEPLWLEEDTRWLDHPFFVMEELVGLEASPQALVAPPYADHAEKIARQKWSILGEIARADPATLGLTEVMDAPAPGDSWSRELDHWVQEIV